MNIRSLLTVLLLLTIAACGDSPTDPTDDLAPTDAFALTVFDGHDVPYTYTGAGCTGPDDVQDDANTLEAEVFEGAFAFGPADGTYAFTIRIRARCVTPTGDATDWQAAQLSHEGPYEGGPDTFLLRDVNAPDTDADWDYQANLAGDTLAVSEINGAGTLTFVR